MEARVRQILSQKVAARSQMRKVLAHLERTAGWWTIQPGEPGAHVEPPGRYDGTELYNGDGPADMMGDVLADIDQSYRYVWGRPAQPEELRAVFEFVFRCVEDKNPVCWPKNEWVDEAVKILGVPMKSLMALPKAKRDELAQMYLDYRNARHCDDPDVTCHGQERSAEELYSAFASTVQSMWHFAQEDAGKILQMRTSRRVASKYIKARVPEGSITINVQDDVPPGVPIVIEGAFRDSPEAPYLYRYLKDIAQDEGYSIYMLPRTLGRGGAREGQFAVQNPDWPGADGNAPWDPASHEWFLDKLMRLYEGRVWEGMPLEVVSWS